ncbi:MAG: hypothetical protein HY243_09360 [Proteobacteria bacterium]|nr:hypothetical protein [Pseudomonadota bacterium]
MGWAGKAILIGGLVAGTLDVGAACLITGRDPIFILQVIASGLLGHNSYDGGLQSAGVGLLAQWFISFGAAAVYVLAGMVLPILLRMPLPSGLVFGAGTYFVMNAIVVPLSAAGRGPWHFALKSFVPNMIAMLVYGVIISYIAAYYAKRR